MSADDAPLLRPRRRRADPGRRDRRADPARARGRPAGGQRRGGELRCPSPSATAPTCRRASRGRSRSRRSSGARRRSRGRRGRAARASPRATRSGTARSRAGCARRGRRAAARSARRSRRRRSRATRRARSSSCIGQLLRIRAVEEPERTVRIDALRRGSAVPPDLRALPRRMGRTRARRRSRPTPSERMRATRRGGVRRRAGDRGETGYPAMWAADRLEVIEDCLRWLERRARGPADPRAAAGGVSRRGSARACAGEQQGALSRDEPIEIELGVGTLRLHGRIDRINWDRAAHALPRGRLQDRQGARRAVRRAPGRADAAAAAVRAGRRRAARDRPATAATPRTSTRRASGEFRTIDWSADDLAARHDEVIGAARRDRRRDRAAATSSSRRGRDERVPLLRLRRDLPDARGGYVEAQGRPTSGSPTSTADPERPVTRSCVDQAARERIVGDLDANLCVEAGGGHRQDDGARRPGRRTLLASGQRRRRRARR